MFPEEKKYIVGMWLQILKNVCASCKQYKLVRLLKLTSKLEAF